MFLKCFKNVNLTLHVSILPIPFYHFDVAFRKEKELDSKIKKPAEAEKYRLETLAEATKQQIVLQAQAEAEAKALKVIT